jgi:GMP synthase (glutamine-hydrolysing)
MKIVIVDNGGQWTHREWRVLRYLSVDTWIVPNDTPFEKIQNVDAILLSGGAPRVALDIERMGNNGEYVDRADFPILGICAGMHFMVGHFRGGTGAALKPEYGRTRLHVDEENDLFCGLPKEFTVWESHNDEVNELPEGFRVLAHSDNCDVQAVKMTSRPLYGLQFHPEVENTEHGYEILGNFIKVVEEWHS